MNDATIIGNLLRGYDTITLKDIKIRVSEPDEVDFIMKSLIKGGIVVQLIGRDYQLTSFGKDLMGIE